MSTLIEKLDAVERRHEETVAKLSEPTVLADQAEFQRLAKLHAELAPMVEQYRDLKKLQRELEEARALLQETIDAEMRDLAQAELEALTAKRQGLEESLQLMLLPKDPADERNIILEIRAGAGGEEAALFAAELLRMYTRYAETQRWKVEMIDISMTGIGGIKEAILTVEGRAAYSRLKFESGVHRVQRVPATEASGRIHTSTVTVAVLPEAQEVDVQINPNDLRIDVYRSTGPGGQSVNTTDSAVRITHLPTGIVAQCQNERSQHKNKAMCMKVLRSRLYDHYRAEKDEEMAKLEGVKQAIAWGSQIRSYVLAPYQLVKDHRTGEETGNVSAVLDGDLDRFIEAFLFKPPEQKT